MLHGYIEEITPDFVHGWAADTEQPDAVLEVAIYIDGRRIAQVACGDFRADLRDTGRYGAGQHGFHYVIAPPLSQLAAERVTVRFARSGVIMPNGEAVLSPWQPLTPILITAPGRSGTTLLMSRLARSPQIVVGEMHPFEVRQIAYWSTVVATLSGPADFERSTHPDRLEGDGFRVGANPYSHPSYTELFQAKELEREYYRDYVPEQWRDVARRMILEYYLRIRDDRQKPAAAFLAEKNNNLDRQTREFARTLFPDLKEIVLVRDPRDLLCSQVAYFRRNISDLLGDITVTLSEMLRIWREEASSVQFVKYEDLILEEERAVQKLAAYLGIGHHALIDKTTETSAFSVHGTSASPEASIGRWKSQLSESHRAWCAEEWQTFLRELQYGID